MTQQEIKDKAMKIAAMMQSPYPHEVATAAALLRKLLDENNMTMRDLGLQSREVSMYCGQQSSSQPSSKEVGAYFGELTEVIWKKRNFSNWERSLIVEISKKYGTAALEGANGYMWLIGFPADIMVAKIMLSKLNKYVESKLEGRTFRSEAERDSYAIGVFDQVLLGIQVAPVSKSIEAAKMSIINQFTLNKYKVPCNPRMNIKVNRGVFRDGQRAAGDFHDNTTNALPSDVNAAFARLGRR